MFDELLNSVVLMLLSILLLGLLLKKLNQPYFVAYIFAGILLGPHSTKIFTHTDTILAIGGLGLLIQMFFTGTEIQVRTLAKHIKKPLLGIMVQLSLSIAFISILGWVERWTITQIVLFGLIISLSSTAIVLEYLHKNNEQNTQLGVLTTGILLMQDFLIAPMLLLINFLAQRKLPFSEILLLVATTMLIAILFRYLVKNRNIKLPFPKTLERDHDLQVFAGLLICFGFAWITHILHLSAALGALFGGILISQATTLNWLENKLEPFRIFFLSLFFLSIGLQINLPFVLEHAGLVIWIVAIILAINNLINALVFRLLKESWKNSLYAGALLSQIGEFSLVLCLVAKSLQLMDDYFYQLTLAVITTTMLFTDIWISIIRNFIYRNPVLK